MVTKEMVTIALCEGIISIALTIIAVVIAFVRPLQRSEVGVTVGVICLLVSSGMIMYSLWFLAATTANTLEVIAIVSTAVIYAFASVLIASFYRDDCDQNPELSTVRRRRSQR